MARATQSPEEAEAKILGKALKALRLRAGLTQHQAAEAFEVTHQAWQRYEAGARRLRFDTLERMARAVGGTYDDLMTERAALLGGGEPKTTGAVVRPLPGMTPVFGRAAAAGERLALAAGEEIRYVHQHPAQIGYKRHGAVEIVGESMYPRYKPRELAYFVFDLLPPRGDDVIVELKDGTAMIKEYVRQDGSSLYLKEFYPEERIFTVSLSEITAIHAVVG